MHQPQEAFLVGPFAAHTLPGAGQQLPAGQMVLPHHRRRHHQSHPDYWTSSSDFLKAEWGNFDNEINIRTLTH